MKIDKVYPPMRLFLLMVSLILFVGIWLTGFTVVHWLLYIPAVFFLIAGITGICLGMNLANMLLAKHSHENN